MKIDKNKKIINLSTFHIGDTSQYFTQAKNPKEIKEIITWADQKNIPYKIIGEGSNVIFPDTPLKGLLIKISGGNIKKNKNQTLKVDSGIRLEKLINTANSLGFKGMETLAGIPGTVGGAIAGNAGAYGNSISKTIDKVTVLQNEKIKTFSKKECNFSYRQSIFKEKQMIVLSAIFKFKKENPEKLKKKSEEIIKKRNNKYPSDIKSSGSFFKNILTKNISKNILQNIDKSKIIDGKIPVGYLLEKSGAKGMKIGNIQVADFHNNFLINLGNGTQKNVKQLAKKLKKQVFNKFKIELNEEIRYF